MSMRISIGSNSWVVVSPSPREIKASNFSLSSEKRAALKLFFHIFLNRFFTSIVKSQSQFVGALFWTPDKKDSKTFYGSFQKLGRRVKKKHLFFTETTSDHPVLEITRDTQLSSGSSNVFAQWAAIEKMPIITCTSTRRQY